MADLIDREEAIAEVIDVIYEFFDISEEDSEHPITPKDEMLLEINKAILTRVRNIPNAERRGKWLLREGYRCSRCNYKLETTGLPSYCPNCGAKMED